MLSPRRILPLLVLLAAGCTATGRQRATDTARKTAAYRQTLERLDERIGLASEALRTLEENAAGSSRSNLETFQTLTRERANLALERGRAAEAWERMDGRAALFLGDWSAEAAGIENADLKQGAAERRGAIEADYRTLARAQRELDLALERHEVALDDLALYLENDLTPAGLATARDSIRAFQEESAALRTRLATQVRAAREAEEALRPDGPTATPR